MNSKLKRGCGIVLHITSLPGKYGIGDFGKCAYDFVSFLKEAGQKYWQILPMGEIGNTNSPYMCCSAFSGGWLLIDPEKLVEESLLKPEDLYKTDFDKSRVDYEAVKPYKDKLLKKAYCAFKKISDTSGMKKEYYKFADENKFWLDDYTLFKAACQKFGSSNWFCWEEGIKNRDPKALALLREEYKDDIERYKFIQFIFLKQWYELKKYANDNGIKIIGDIPIYIDYESADVWSNRQLFDLEESGKCSNIAGFPPDFFSKKGQIWDNPLYKWEEHEKENFDWWIKRIKQTLKLVDYLRIDHFKGFDKFYSIPTSSYDAFKGVFKKGPGHKIMDCIKENIKDMPIIAEDLGIVDEDLEKLRDDYALPGMRILQFGFFPEDAMEYNPSFMPHNYVKNCIAYTGTHDNLPIKQWSLDKSTDRRTIENFKRYIGKENVPDEDINFCREMIRLVYSSVADVAMIQLQDILEISQGGRMADPCAKMINWRWRFSFEDITPDKINYLRELAEIYER